MGLGSYIFLLVINANFFTLCLIVALFLLCIMSWFIIFYKSRILNKYLKEISNFNKEFNDKNIDLKEFYNKLLIKKTHVVGLSVIFFSGFKEFIYLHRKGISDVVVVAKMVKHVMNISMLKEINYLYKNLYILSMMKFISVYIGIFGFLIGIIVFLQKLNISLYKQLSFSVVTFSFIEILLPLIIGLMIAFIIDIFYNKYLNILNIISNSYNIFTYEFIMLLYHKLYN